MHASRKTAIITLKILGTTVQSVVVAGVGGLHSMMFSSNHLIRH